MKSAIKKMLYLICRWVNLPGFWASGIDYGRNVKIRGLIYSKCSKRHSIVIEDNVNINSSFRSDPIGGDSRTIFCTRDNGRIHILKGAGISNTTIVAASQVEVGEYSVIGGSTKIYDTDFHSSNAEERLNGNVNIKTKPIKIGNRVFIGGHCIILKGVTIGDEAVIGAGSVVASDIPAREVWAGSPAKFIKNLD